MPINFTILLFISFGFCSKLVEYKLSDFYGEIFFDSSGKGNHGQNGESILTGPGNTRPCDRGAFFRDADSTYIMLPPNEIVPTPISLNSIFSIVMWMFPYNNHDYYLTYRILDSSNYFYVQRIFISKYLSAKIDNDGFNSGDVVGSKTITEKKWNIFALINQGNTSSFYCNGVLDFTITQESSYTEEGSYLHYIGYINNSFEGFVWSYYLFDEIVTLTDFYEVDNGGNCLVNRCTDSCLPTIYGNEMNQCISEVDKVHQNGLGISCDSCTHGCKISTCYDCEDCLLDSCYMNGTTQQCTCNFGMVVEGNCTCSVGAYYTSSAMGCVDCYEECTNCSEALKCLTCKDSNASPNLEIGCECNSGYYNITNLTSDGACLKCHEDCKLCNDQFRCISCISNNSKPDVSQGCVCEDGYYKDINSTCQPCQEDCETCLDSNTCIKCKSDFAILSDSICICSEGYYNSSNTSLLICTKCGENCSVCENSEKCSKCEYNYMNIEENMCRCPLNTQLISDNCVANEGFFIKKSKSRYYAQECHPSCKSCTDAEENACVECVNNLLKVSQLCNTCSQHQYLESYTCYNCSGDCLDCKSESYCLTCSDLSKTPVNGTCKYDCSLEFYINDNKCSPCLPLCSICTNSTYCIECKNNSNFYDDKCLCSAGFKSVDNECEKQYFEAKMFISENNFVKIVFNESTSIRLKLEHFKFAIGNREDFKVKLLKNNKNKELLFSLVFEDDVKSETNIEVYILISYLKSVNQAELVNYNLFGELFEFSSSDIDSIANIPLSTTQISVRAGVSSSICSSIVSNPAATWTLLSIIQLLALLPINSCPLTPNLIKFLKGIGKFNLIPNLFENYYPSNTSGSPYLEARRYGIRTSVFFLNLGPSLVFFLAITLVWPIAFLFSKCSSGKFYEKLKNLLKNYKFSFFIRFWIQMYLEIGIYAIIQLKASLNHWLGYVNRAVATICCIAIFFTPIITFFIGFYSDTKIKENDRKFFKKWGSLYSEFKNNKGFWSSQYYFLYFSRRLAYLIAQVYLNNHLYVQGAIHISCSLALISFLLVYRPFKSIAILRSNLISEFGTFVVITLSYGFNLNVEVKTKEILEIVIMFTTLSTIFFHVIFSIVVFADSLISIWKKFIKKKNLEVDGNNKKGVENNPQMLST